MALAGIPIPETQCIGDSLDTINSAFQTLDAAVAAAAGAGVTQIVAGSNISISPTGGTGAVTINGAAPFTLPCRLGEYSCTITNWNDAITNGWYMGSDATNAPGAGWYMGYVQAHNAGWTTQIVHQFAGDNSTWIREQNDSVWGSWTPYGGASVTVSDTPPGGASAGDLWFDSSSGVTSVYYDGTWVDVGGGDSGTSAGSVNGIVKSDGAGNFSAAVAGTDYTAPSNFTGTNQSLTTNGYQRLPGGLIIQWGSSVEGSVTFPITFPTAVHYVNVAGYPAGGNPSWLAAAATTTGFIAYVGPVDSVSTMYWIALGY